MDKNKMPFLQNICISLQNNISVTKLAIITAIVMIVMGSDVISLLLLASLWYCWFSRGVIKNDVVIHKRISKWVLSPVVLFPLAYLILSLFRLFEASGEIRSRALLLLVMFSTAIPWISIVYMFTVIFQNDRPKYRSQKKMLDIKKIIITNIIGFVFIFENLALFPVDYEERYRLYGGTYLWGSWYSAVYNNFSEFRIVSFIMMVLHCIQLIAITMFTVKIAFSLNAAWKENKQYCPYCGAAIPADKKFCVKCGNKVQ